MERADRGHHVIAHTADVIVEGWGATRPACLEESIAALANVFCEPSAGAAAHALPVTVGGSGDVDLLVHLLEEAIYLVDARRVVALRARLDDTDDGGVAGFFDVVPVTAVEPVGAVPKGVSYSGARLGERDGRWWSHIVVDV